MEETMTTPETPHTPALSFGLPLPIGTVRVRFAEDGAVVDLPEDTRVKPCVDANLVPSRCSPSSAGRRC